MDIHVEVVKKITKVVFENGKEYEKKFAKEFVENYNAKKAYETAYADVQAVRASSMLQDVTIWEMIFENLRLKNKAKEAIDEYDSIVENFQLSPFRLYEVYVCNQSTKKERVTLANLLNIDCIQSIIVLGALYKFFRVLENAIPNNSHRQYFYKTVLSCLDAEIELASNTGRESELKYALSSCKKNNIYFQEFIEKYEK